MTIYMLLIQYDPTIPSDGSPSRQPEHAQLMEVMRGRGHHLSGAGLVPFEAFATRVRQDDGHPIVLDGPFAETKEALGGYYIVDCSEAEAMEYAGLIPVEPRSWVEVRPRGDLPERLSSVPALGAHSA
jgi:hypothetical protein